jgi:hypothetical protein
MGGDLSCVSEADCTTDSRGDQYAIRYEVQEVDLVDGPLDQEFSDLPSKEVRQ